MTVIGDTFLLPQPPVDPVGRGIYNRVAFWDSLIETAASPRGPPRLHRLPGTYIPPDPIPWRPGGWLSTKANPHPQIPLTNHFSLW